MNVRIFAICLLPFSVLNCKASSNQRETSQPELKSMMLTEQHSLSNFLDKVVGHDGAQPTPFTMQFDKLPKEGSVARGRVPYSGFWYPNASGGTAIRWDHYSPSALEKYDSVFHGGQLKATQWELTFHGISAISWAGHAQGWAAAAERYQEPMRSVQRGSVVFGMRDVKALMAEIHMSSKTIFLGGQTCFESFLRTTSEKIKPGDKTSCEEVTPASFHLIVTNWVGVGKKILLADLDNTDAVSPVPIYQYNAKTQKLTAKEAAIKILGDQTTEETLDKNGTDFWEVSIDVTFAKRLTHEPLGNGLPTHRAEQKSFHYVLSVDSKGSIIDGRWFKESEKDHPDFIWIALEAQKGDGTRFFGNPFVDPTEVLKIWADSVGASSLSSSTEITESELLKM